MISHLEDDFSDIIQKARTGLGLSIEALSRTSGLNPDAIKALEAAERLPNKGEIRELARPLNLAEEKLSLIAQKAWQPAPCPESFSPSVIPLAGSIGGYAVHGYLCYDPDSRQAALIDTAYNPQLVLEAIRQDALTLSVILLTHCHYDHIGGLETLRKATGARVMVHAQELPLYHQHSHLEPDRLIEDGEIIPVGRLAFVAHATPGHTPGGTSYQVGSLAFVGDALFAGSTGRSMSPSGYRMLLASLREKILSLPVETYLFPGHGPVTTVGEELEHNPFFGAEG